MTEGFKRAKIIDVDKHINITLSKSLVENLMQRIDHIDKGYLKQIKDGSIVLTDKDRIVYGQELKSILAMKRIVLGTIADLLLEFLDKGTK